MKTEFVIALTQLAAERNLPKEVILKTVESALVPIFKKTSFAPDQEISVKILSQTGDVKVYAQKKVVKRRSDPRKEMLLSEARKHRPEAQVGDIIEVECTPENAGRIAAQTAKQVILQRLRDAERDAIFGEYADKEGDVVSGVVNAIDARHIMVDLGKAEAILPLPEQMATDRYRLGQRHRYYLLKVLRTPRGTQLVVSRTHQSLLRRLFEIEIPEVYNGTVEIKAVAREPGHRSKVAVSSRQEGVDAVGSCLGLRSIRIQNITKELGGEKIDVIQWHPDPAVFIGNALSPASVVKVDINGDEKSASVVVPDKQLSLAIGKGGQNARLAARLTGWRIDIKSTSMLEGVVAPKAEAAPPIEEVAPVAEAAAEIVAVEGPAETVAAAAVEAEAVVPAVEEAPPAAEVAAPVEFTAEPEAEAPQRVYSFEEILSEIEVVTGNLKGRYSKKKVEEKPVVILDTKGKKGKKGSPVKEDDVAGKPKAKKGARRVVADDFDDYTSEADLEAEADLDVAAEEEPESDSKP
ncbi:MAG: transcription termination/antitermination protein NusA [Chloroflexi bacterium]|nr:transcription termination/antitermination protein NusA [Chloroflexota bacterium]